MENTLLYVAAISLSFVNALKNVYIKKIINTINANALAGMVSGITCVFLIPQIVVEWLPPFSWNLLVAALVWWAMYFVGRYCNFTALRYWEVSYIVPLQALITINVVITSFLILGEEPNLWGGIGIAIIIVGVYLLSFKSNHTKILDPFLYLIRNKASRIYLITTIMYGFTVTIDKIGIAKSSMLFWILCMNGILFLMSIPHMYKHWQDMKSLVNNHSIAFTKVMATHIATHLLWAFVIMKMLTGYMHAFKSSSGLFAVILGWTIFHEKDITRKLIAACIMLVGIVLITMNS
jgi:drug/metabolite transporter (DMT)-like permease